MGAWSMAQADLCLEKENLRLPIPTRALFKYSRFLAI